MNVFLYVCMYVCMYYACVHAGYAMHVGTCMFATSSSANDSCTSSVCWVGCVAVLVLYGLQQYAGQGRGTGQGEDEGWCND